MNKFCKDVGVDTIASMISFGLFFTLVPIMTSWFEASNYGTFDSKLKVDCTHFPIHEMKDSSCNVCIFTLNK